MKKLPTPILRKLLRFILKTDSEFDGFCLDYLHDTYSLFAAGMDRAAKENILLQREESGAIIAALCQYSPDRVNNFLSNKEHSVYLATQTSNAEQDNIKQLHLNVIKATAHTIERQLCNSHFSLKYKSQHYVPRALEDQILKWLSLPTAQRAEHCFLILASAGCGKTNLLCHLATISVTHRPTFLISGAHIRLDDSLGLWEPIFEVLQTASELRHERNDVKRLLKEITTTLSEGATILIDAINEFHDPVMLKRELRLFIEEAGTVGLTVVLSCRDYYWGLFDAPWWSLFVKLTSESNETKSTKRVLGNFSPNEARAAFMIYSSSYDVSAQLEGNSLEQFRHPLLLRFFCETYKGHHLGILRDIRLKSLFDTYWGTKLSSIAERMLDQGEVGTISDIAQFVGNGILNVARRMLHENNRVIPLPLARQLMRSEDSISSLRAPYGRILDEYIIFEEFSSLKPSDAPLVAFVFEEFMEYAMARSLTEAWKDLTPVEITELVVDLTGKYESFSQVFGVILYLALMLKEERNVSLWPALIGLGSTWERVVLEAFRKLPVDQIDDGVFQAIVDLLSVQRIEVQIEALELLKFGRLKRIPTPELITAVGDLVVAKDLRLRRRALHALACFPPDFAIPLIERAIQAPKRTEKIRYVVIGNAMKALAKISTPEARAALARTWAIHCTDNYTIDMDTIMRSPDLDANAFVPLLHHEELLIRIGAIKILGFSSSQEGFHELQVIATRTCSPGDLELFNQLPLPVKKNLISDYRSAISKNLSLEAYFANLAVSRLSSEIHRAVIEERWHSSIKFALKNKEFSGLPDSPDDLSIYSSVDLIIFIIKSGLEHRSSTKWHVGGTAGGIWIKPPIKRLQKEGISSEDRAELCALLNITEIDGNRVYISNGYGYHNYWKEYIYRAWGVEPVVRGSIDESWD